MRRTYLIAALLYGSQAIASPSAPADDLERLLAEKGLLNRLEQVRQSAGNKASELVFTALGFMGVPYRRGGNSAETGFDCSGFVKAMYEQTVGLILPRRAEQQAASTQKIDRSDLQPGDLVFFNTMRRAFSHVGIYVGEGKFIHSPKPGAEVRVEDMGVAYWRSRFDGARRVDAPTPEPVSDLLANPSFPPAR
jgi:cell wall-associated NlpC family hydrolase